MSTRPKLTLKMLAKYFQFRYRAHLFNFSVSNFVSFSVVVLVDNVMKVFHNKFYNALVTCLPLSKFFTPLRGRITKQTLSIVEKTELVHRT